MNYSQPYLGFYAAALKSHLGIANTYLRGVQRIRQAQVEQISASSDECAQWLKKAESVDDFTALHSLQSDMISQHVERVTSYWNKVSHAMTQLQLELSGALQDCSATVTQDVRHQADLMQADLSQGAVGLFKPLLDPGTLFGFGNSEKAEQHGDETEPGDHNGSGFVPRSSGARRAHR